MFKHLFKKPYGMVITPEMRLTGLENTIQDLRIDIKKLKSANKDLGKIIELEKCSDESIYKKYKYTQWCEITPVLQNYLKDRFRINVIKYGGIGIPVGIYANHTDFFGQTVEKYYVFDIDGKALTHEERHEEFKAATIGSDGE